MLWRYGALPRRQWGNGLVYGGSLIAGTLGALLLVGASPAVAAPRQYGFTSLGNPVELRAGLAATAEERLFGDGVVASGTFAYTSEPDFKVGDIQGVLGPIPVFGPFPLELSVGGTGITRSDLSAVIGNGLCSDAPSPGVTPAPRDCLPLSISFTSFATASLLGLERTDSLGQRFGLVDVFLGWVEGRNGTGAFLNGIDLPATLPPADTGLPLLTLVFRQLDLPEGAAPVRHSVTFEQVLVTPAPAPLWLLGTALMMLAGRRHRGARAVPPALPG